MPLLPRSPTSLTFKVRRKSPALISLRRNSLCFRPAVLPTISPFSTVQSVGSPTQPGQVAAVEERRRRSRASRASGTWTGLAR